MNIAICDDLAEERMDLRQHLHAYFSDVVLLEYDNGIDLVESHQKSPFDLILLDMLMPKLNGIETAEKIRAFDEQVPIVFVTNTREFALQSYSVLAFDYLIKPVTAETMERCLSRFTKQIPDKRFISVDYMGVRTDILLCNISYIESNLRKMIIHLRGGKELTLTAKMEDFLGLTDEPDFCRCHKSFIVNLSDVDTISGGNFCLIDGEELRISRTFLNDAKKAYFDYAFGKSGMRNE